MFKFAVRISSLRLLLPRGQIANPEWTLAIPLVPTTRRRGDYRWRTEVSRPLTTGKSNVAAH